MPGYQNDKSFAKIGVKREKIGFSFKQGKKIIKSRKNMKDKIMRKDTKTANF
jgi:hypothetical protein